MREIVNSTYISLDGVIERPETWPDLGGFGAEGNQIQTDLVASCSDFLMGRRTYESFAAVFPGLSGDPLADRINAMPKHVASRTLTNPTWDNTRVIDGDLVSEVRKLKESPGGDIAQFGFGPVARTLMAAGLLERLTLWVHPVFIGGGGPADLLYRDAPVTSFELLEATALQSGIVVLDYRLRESDPDD